MGLLNRSVIPTLTSVERLSDYNKYMDEVRPNGRGWLMSDFSNVLYYSLNSKIGYLDECSAVYRVLNESSSHSHNIDKLFRFYDSADDIRRYFINQYIKNEKERKGYLMMIKQNEILR